MQRLSRFAMVRRDGGIDPGDGLRGGERAKAKGAGIAASPRSPFLAVRSFRSTLPGSASGALGRSLKRPVAVPLHPPKWCPVPSGGWPIRASLALRQSLPTRADPAWRFRDCLLVLGSGLLLDPKDLLLSVAALLAKAVERQRASAASAVRQVCSGGNSRGVFSDTAAGFAAVSSSCFFRSVSEVSFRTVPSEAPFR